MLVALLLSLCPTFAQEPPERVHAGMAFYEYAIIADTWGHDFKPAQVAMETMMKPWAAPWFGEIIDEKPIPWWSLVEKKVPSGSISV